VIAGSEPDEAMTATSSEEMMASANANDFGDHAVRIAVPIVAIVVRPSVPATPGRRGMVAVRDGLIPGFST
jgi:hypothetical protein